MNPSAILDFLFNNEDIYILLDAQRSTWQKLFLSFSDNYAQKSTSAFFYTLKTYLRPYSAFQPSLVFVFPQLFVHGLISYTWLSICFLWRTHLLGCSPALHWKTPRANCSPLLRSAAVFAHDLKRLSMTHLWQEGALVIEHYSETQ